MIDETSLFGYLESVYEYSELFSVRGKSRVTWQHWVCRIK